MRQSASRSAYRTKARRQRPRRTLGLEGGVDPGGDVGGLALAAEGRGLLGEVGRVARAHHLGGVPQHRQRADAGAELGGDAGPHRQDPEGARVLDQDLLGVELPAQPFAQLGLDLGRAAGLGRDRAGGRAGVDRAHRHRVEHPLVELGDPLGLVVAARVLLVRRHLRLRHVQAQPLEGARDARRAGPAGTGDEEEVGTHAGEASPRGPGPARCRRVRQSGRRVRPTFGGPLRGGPGPVERQGGHRPSDRVGRSRVLDPVPSSSQCDATFFDGWTRGGSPGIFGWSGG